MKKKLTALLLGVPLLLSAQNPVIRDQFSADPTARVFKRSFNSGNEAMLVNCPQ